MNGCVDVAGVGSSVGFGNVSFSIVSVADVICPASALASSNAQRFQVPRIGWPVNAARVVWCGVAGAGGGIVLPAPKTPPGEYTPVTIAPASVNATPPSANVRTEPGAMSMSPPALAINATAVP